MLQLIAFIIFTVSIAGMLFILFRKAPVLVQLPQNGHHGFKKNETILHIEKRIKELHFSFFKKQVWLHKLLSWIKIQTLKAERKIDELLHGIRKKAQELDKEIKKKK